MSKIIVDTIQNRSTGETISVGDIIEGTTNPVPQDYYADKTEIKVGLDAGATNQGVDSIAIGRTAGLTNQEGACVAIGAGAGKTNQKSNSVAIGTGAGNADQNFNAIAIGNGAGIVSQGLNAVAIGYDAGGESQGTHSVCIGTSAGKNNSQAEVIAIGLSAALISPGNKTITMGSNIGNNIGQGSIAIGTGSSNSIPTTKSLMLSTSFIPNSPGNNSITLTAGTNAWPLTPPGEGDISLITPDASLIVKEDGLYVNNSFVGLPALASYFNIGEYPTLVGGEVLYKVHATSNRSVNFTAAIADFDTNPAEDLILQWNKNGASQGAITIKSDGTFTALGNPTGSVVAGDVISLTVGATTGNGSGLSGLLVTLP